MAAPNTSKWLLNHTMLRVKDPARSVKFYEFLGMKQIRKLEFPEAKFDLYFLAYDGLSSASVGKHWTDREGLIELTHNYGTEKDDNYKIHNGNSEPRGFGHICISVDNLEAACSRIEQAGYRFHKRLSDGRMRNIAFALDPDDYWVEIIGQRSLEETKGVTSTDTGSYRSNHSMIRIKNPEASLRFYRDIMGMTLLRTSEQKAAGFTLYFLGYPGEFEIPKQSETGASDVNPLARKEGILELTHNYGTEKEEGQVYHNGNDQPQGFGHICLSVDDLDAACQYLEEKKVNWKKRLTDGRMKNVAFVLDPDNYWVEVIQNETLKKTSDW
ncbi:hypothetical protein DV736_g1217, partial [Chaetothyriales sp. CBS 134916]